MRGDTCRQAEEATIARGVANEITSHAPFAMQWAADCIPQWHGVGLACQHWMGLVAYQWGRWVGRFAWDAWVGVGRKYRAPAEPMDDTP